MKTINEQTQEPIQKQLDPALETGTEGTTSGAAKDKVIDPCGGAQANPAAASLPHTSSAQKVLAIPSPTAQRAEQLPRVPLGEALRLTGLDEWQIAQDMAVLVDTLKARDEPKLLLDALKESSRCLEGGKSGPVSVALVHHIPRPRRQNKKVAPEQAAQGAESASNDVE